MFVGIFGLLIIQSAQVVSSVVVLYTEQIFITVPSHIIYWRDDMLKCQVS